MRRDRGHRAQKCAPVVLMVNGGVVPDHLSTRDRGVESAINADAATVTRSSFCRAGMGRRFGEIRVYRRRAGLACGRPGRWIFAAFGAILGAQEL